jgi:bifunctional enzyme CysN/CysC
VRALHDTESIPFFEIWVSTPPDECARRDPKGLWARARSGELSGMTGLDAPYEAPKRPALTLDAEVPVADAVGRVATLLERPALR